MEKKISAIILVGGKYQDKKLLKKCLDSVSWCDEVINVDTSKIKGGFAEWRNQGAQKARGNWLLYLDTDEEVTNELKNVILKAINSDEFSAYAIPRKNIFLGHEMKWGGWSPDYVLRLIKKDKLLGWRGELHEQPKINGEISHLSIPIVHRSHRNLTEMVDKTNDWSEIEAKLLYKSKHPPMNIFRFFTAGFREFFKRGFIKLGFLDGIVGIVEIYFQTFSRLVTYSKLWEMQLKAKGDRVK